MKFINLTPHRLNIQREDGSFLEIPPSGEVARVSSTISCVDIIDGIPLHETSYGEVEGLPPTKLGIVLIVSGMVESIVQRIDVYSPGELIRDDNGRPVGCRGLKQTRGV